MDANRKRQILEHRLALLRGHVAANGSSPGFERELEKAEAELRELGEEEQPRGHDD